MVYCSLDNGVNEGKDDTPHFNFAIGVTIAVSTSFIQSLGLTIQRKSYVINENIYPKELRRSACRQPLWHLGFDTYIISNIIGSAFSIGYLPIVILAPLGAVTLVFNAFFAKILLGDVFTKKTLIGAYRNVAHYFLSRDMHLFRPFSISDKKYKITIFFFCPILLYLIYRNIFYSNWSGYDCTFWSRK